MSSSVPQTSSGFWDNFFASGFDRLQRDYPSIQELAVTSKEFLYHQGEYCEYVFWIKNGIVKLSHLTVEGSEITSALLKHGDMAGNLAGVTQLPMENTAQPIGSVGLYRMTYNDFRSLLSRHAVLAWHTFVATQARKQQLERKLRTILTQSVEIRLAAMLLELAEMFGIRCTHGYALEIHLTQQDVADLIGASRSVVSTVLNDFRSRGMLDYTRNQICIYDKVLADFCSTL